MIRRLLFATVITAHCACCASPARAVGVFVQLFPLTGEIRLRNKDAAPFDFIVYEIESPSGALNSTPSVWKSISDNYDVSGNGFIDPINNWEKLSAPSTSSMDLSEGVVPNPGGRLPGMRAISLGNVWNPNAVPTPDLTAKFFHPNNQQANVTIEFALDGDYVPDGIVNQLDYDFWRRSFGSTSVLLTDGNLNGIIDAADYAVWRNNVGKSIPGFSVGMARDGEASMVAAGVVPEPASTALLLVACPTLLGWMAARSRRQR